ncbi:hypothetical protein HUG20_11615 [Salicibibacter cibi]|uniref:Uncharacterized protein n=1 Tax=Salicibibacter cibi TaxID=2743001 RepID=A0A7T7CFV5_9BACI|nr:hypothetical protein [Salicibibacter cibi]QQK80479.1 hypothetical protein HUG20_11615 [Salicibibacter cibi]
MPTKEKNWFKMPFREGLLIILIVLFLIVFMLPWSYDITFLNISLVAWIGLSLQLVIPLLAIALTWENKKENQNKGEKSNVPKDF